MRVETFENGKHNQIEQQTKESKTADYVKVLLLNSKI